MDMAGMTMTTTGAAASPTSSTMDMGGMMGMGGDSCKISMLWNWNTIDACFISSSWQIKSQGMFAGSCIGVVLLVMSLEFLRRATKEFDRYLIAQHVKKHSDMAAASASDSSEAVMGGGKSCVAIPRGKRIPKFRPSVLQQSVRALLHMLQFAVAYFVMLLAMYYNGYFIICIFIGAYIGGFLFQWETLSVGETGNTSAAEEATVCCG